MYISNAGRHSTHGTTTYSAGDSDTARTLISLRDEQSLDISDYLFTFDNAGTGSAKISLYDDESGTSSGSLTDPVDTVTVASGDSVVVESVTREVAENDLLIEVSGNDSEVTATVGAMVLTG